MSKYGTRYSKDGKTSRVVYPQENNSGASMRNRCLNPNHAFYHLYGGKGIQICERWLGKDGFINFLEDMGPKPNHTKTRGGRSSYSLDRLDSDKGYCPENVISGVTRSIEHDSHLRQCGVFSMITESITKKIGIWIIQIL